MESAQKESVGEGVLLCQAHVQTLGKESESLPAKPEALHLQIPMLCEPCSVTVTVCLTSITYQERGLSSPHSLRSFCL